jgi:hypothetical protein
MLWLKAVGLMSEYELELTYDQEKALTLLGMGFTGTPSSRCSVVSIDWPHS